MSAQNRKRERARERERERERDKHLPAEENTFLDEWAVFGLGLGLKKSLSLQ